MDKLAYIGLDVHKKTVAWCAKDERGRALGSGQVGATRRELAAWTASLRRPWVGALEATLFTGWIYDFLRPQARELKVAHPVMVKALVAGKKKNDRVDAELLCDLLRCSLLPECHMAPPLVRELRCVLRQRGLAVREMVKMKNANAGLLMQCGVEYHKQRLHGRKYFAQLLGQIELEVPASVLQLLRGNRVALELHRDTSRQLTRALVAHPALAARVELLMSIPGVGEVGALTWALEIDDPQRFGSIAKAISYCGLCSAQRESAGVSRRGPLSKQRNQHLQTMLVEAAHLAPRFNPELAALHARELARGNRNRATLAVARKLVAWLLAVDKRGRPFEPREPAD